jgi:crotonobetainyl-CoA:carnitine CoA-transferase CaiB-like acyl-CoA transferase
MPVAFVGCGHIHAPDYARLLLKMDDVSVKYVWDHNADRGAQFAKAMNAKFVSDPKVIWADAAIKAAVICSETNRHRDLVLPAAEAKKHLFIELPPPNPAKWPPLSRKTASFSQPAISCGPPARICSSKNRLTRAFLAK